MPSPSSLRVRQPAVAGSFYPASATQLTHDITTYLSRAPAQPIHFSNTSQWLICPHAGYDFSAPVAAPAYALLNKKVTTVILVGPSHHTYFKGIAIPPVDAYATPLGNVLFNKEVCSALEKSLLVTNVADNKEHSLEVQLPFLQTVLGNFLLVPLLTGDVDPVQVAELIAPYLNEHTALIASSDLSHFETNAQAQKIDAQSIATVLSLQENGFFDGCGHTAVQILMHCAKLKNLAPQLIDARNSFQTAPHLCSADRVVGYASFAFFPTNPPEEPFSKTDQQWLLSLARSSLRAAVSRDPLPAVIDPPSTVSGFRGCFVTLTKQNRLRGCIGFLEGIKPLYQAVQENAISAALRDPRFEPVSASEIPDITIEISVLSQPQPLPFTTPNDLLAQLVPGRDGVILSDGRHQSTYLPQVWEQLPNKIDFLESLALKGGMPASGWKQAKVATYQAFHFSEESPFRLE